MDQQHEMVLETTHSSGEEEWYCPACGRRMVITWHPWKKVVVEQGDMYAAHSASKSFQGLQLGSIGVTNGNVGEEQSSTESLTEDPYLSPWIQWLEDVDLDDLGKGKVQ